MVRLCLFVLLSVSLVQGECPQHCHCSRYFHFVRCTNASLTEIPRFGIASQVTILNLSHNNITRLEGGAFQKRNLNVSILNLYGNNLTAVDGDAFRGLSGHLLDLTLRSNPHIKLPERGFHLETLIFLDLSSCNLETIPASFFQGMRDIIFLFLTDNKLTYFDPTIIEPNKGLKLDYLYLDINKFTKLDIKLVMYQKSELWIDRNPFHCDCAFRVAYTALAEREVTPYITCQTPAFLHGVTGQDLLKKNLLCEGTELVASLQGRSWWHLHQWWILILCALAVVLIAAGVHYLHKYNKTYTVLEWLWNPDKFSTGSNTHNYFENVLTS